MAGIESEGYQTKSRRIAGRVAPRAENGLEASVKKEDFDLIHAKYLDMVAKVASLHVSHADEVKDIRLRLQQLERQNAALNAQVSRQKDEITTLTDERTVAQQIAAQVVATQEEQKSLQDTLLHERGLRKDAEIALAIARSDVSSIRKQSVINNEQTENSVGAAEDELQLQINWNEVTVGFLDGTKNNGGLADLSLKKVSRLIDQSASNVFKEVPEWKSMKDDIDLDTVHSKFSANIKTIAKELNLFKNNPLLDYLCSLIYRDVVIFINASDTDSVHPLEIALGDYESRFKLTKKSKFLHLLLYADLETPEAEALLRALASTDKEHKYTIAEEQYNAYIEKYGDIETIFEKRIRGEQKEEVSQNDSIDEMLLAYLNELEQKSPEELTDNDKMLLVRMGRIVELFLKPEKPLPEPIKEEPAVLVQPEETISIKQTTEELIRTDSTAETIEYDEEEYIPPDDSHVPKNFLNKLRRKEFAVLPFEQVVALFQEISFMEFAQSLLADIRDSRRRAPGVIHQLENSDQPLAKMLAEQLLEKSSLKDVIKIASNDFYPKKSKTQEASKKEIDFTDEERQQLGEVISYEWITDKLPQRLTKDILEMYASEENTKRNINELFNHNLRLVLSIAGKNRNKVKNMEVTDLFNEGTFGLKRAIEKFDWRRKLKFSYYSAWWIRVSIDRAIASQEKTIRLTVDQETALKRLKRKTGELEGQLRRTPTDEELASALTLPVDKVLELRSLAYSYDRIQSLDQTFAYYEGDEGDSLSSHLESKQDSYKAEFNDGIKESIAEALANLNPEEIQLLDLRFGLSDGNGRTISEMEREMGLKRGNLNPKFKKILNKLQRVAPDLKLYLQD